MSLRNGFLRPDWSAPQTVHSLVTTRLGGVSQTPYDSLNLGDHVGDAVANVQANRALLKQALPTDPLWLKQIHSTAVSTPANRLLEADAVVTNIPNEVLAIMTADCLPVLFTNQTGTVVGAAHAGWRGLCGGVLENTVSEMSKLSLDGISNDIMAWMGPAIGPDAFEVGNDVLEAFQCSGVPVPAQAFVPILGSPGKYFANIYELARSRLTAVGIQSICGGQFCTVTHSEQFFSYRRDGVTGRFASLIWIGSSN